jgi:Transposase IS116/IS110/IS902 family
VGGAEEIQLTDADPPERDGPQVAPAGYGLHLNVGLVLLPLLPTLPRTSLGCTCRVHASGDKLRYGRLRPDVNRYLKWAFIEAANAICLMRRRYPHRHVSHLYERIARRKGHPKAIGAVARHLAEATYWLLSKQEPYREPQASAVSSTGDKRDVAMSSRKLEF